MAEPLAMAELAAMPVGQAVFRGGRYFVRLPGGWAEAVHDGPPKPVGLDDVQGSVIALLSPYGPSEAAVEAVRKAMARVISG